MEKRSYLSPRACEQRNQGIVSGILLIHALHEVGQCVDRDRPRWCREAIVAALLRNSLANAISIESVVKEQGNLGETWPTGQRWKNQRDPKQKEKAFIRECWNEWQKKPDSYDSQAAFARDMLSKCEHLTSQKKIEDWCHEWKQSTSSS